MNGDTPCDCGACKAARWCGYPERSHTAAACAAIRIAHAGHRFGRSHWCLQCRAIYADLVAAPETACVGRVWE